MTKYQIGDLECTAQLEPSGKYRAVVQVNGLKLDPPQAHPYVYTSAEVFDTESEAFHHGKDHLDRHFPPV